MTMLKSVKCIVFAWWHVWSTQRQICLCAAEYIDVCVFAKWHQILPWSTNSLQLKTATITHTHTQNTFAQKPFAFVIIICCNRHARIHTHVFACFCRIIPNCVCICIRFCNIVIGNVNQCWSRLSNQCVGKSRVQRLYLVNLHNAE